MSRSYIIFFERRMMPSQAEAHSNTTTSEVCLTCCEANVLPTEIVCGDSQNLNMQLCKILRRSLEIFLLQMVNL